MVCVILNLINEIMHKNYYLTYKFLLLVCVHQGAGMWVVLKQQLFLETFNIVTGLTNSLAAS